MKTALVTFLFATLPAAADVAQEAYLKASNTDSDHDNETVQYYEDLAELTGTSIGIDFGEQFGSVVAVSGDTAVVGAPREHSGSAGVNGDQSDDSLLDAGAAYVLIRIGTTWVQQAYLKASNPIEGAAFGTSVAIDGDTIVVGAPGEDGGSSGVNGDESDQSAASSGAAYVFVRSGTTWSQEAYLKASNPDSDDNFGSAVAIDGDRIVVGAPHEDSAIGGIGANQSDNSATNAGAAYLFFRTGTTWSQERYLKAPLPGGETETTLTDLFTGEYTVTSTGDFFGTSVDISGLTVVIGAPGEDSAATGVGGDQTDESAEHAGAAYVFKKPAVGPVWLLQAYLKASNPDGENSSLFFISSADRFGTAVAIDGNLLAVGAPNEDSAATGINGDEADNSLPYAGASYVFSRTDDVWSQQAYLKASNPSAYDGFGASLSLSGTILAVGAPGEDGISTGIDGPEDNDLATDAGACYVFKKPGINWAQFRYLKPSYLKAEAPLNPGEEDPCATPDIDFSGIFTDSDTEPEPELISNDRFGSTVAIDGTVVLGGSPFEDSDATGVDGDQSNSDAPNSGAAYAFDLDAQPPVAQGDIAIQQPLGRGLISGANLIDYGLVGGGEGSTLTFNIANVGGAGLTGINISVIGNHASDFAVSPDSFLIMPAGSTNTFDVTFTPTAAGIRGATLSIASSDIDENPFTIALTGIGVGQNSDQDGDGMTDLAEWNLRFLGFDWQQRQTRLVNYYYNNAQGAGLFTQSQISNLSADPVLGPGSSDDKLTLTMDWKISDDVKSFSDLPATPGEVSLNADGDIVFEFDIPGDRAFFKVLVGE